MKRRLAWFAAGCLAFWAGAAALAFLTADETAAAHCSVAAALCLLPSLATLLWASWGGTQTPEQQLLIAFGGMGVRMFVVLGVGLLLTFTVPYFAARQQSFWLWVLVFYLFDLGLEMVLLVAGRRLPERHNDSHVAGDLGNRP